MLVDKTIVCIFCAAYRLCMAMVGDSRTCLSVVQNVDLLQIRQFWLVHESF